MSMQRIRFKEFYEVPFLFALHQFNIHLAERVDGEKALRRTHWLTSAMVLSASNNH